jgi:hypothetical protein
MEDVGVTLKVEERADSPPYDSDNNNDCSDCGGEHKG